MRTTILEIDSTELDREFPAFFFHLLVGPMLQLLKKRRFNHGKTDAHAPLITNPHESRFRLKQNFTFRQHEAYVEQSRKTQRLFHAVEAHAPRAEVDSLHVNLFALRIPDGNRSLNTSPKEFLLLITDEAQRGRTLSGSKTDVV